MFSCLTKDFSMLRRVVPLGSILTISDHIDPYWNIQVALQHGKNEMGGGGWGWGEIWMFFTSCLSQNPFCIISLLLPEAEPSPAGWGVSYVDLSGIHVFVCVCLGGRPLHSFFHELYKFSSREQLSYSTCLAPLCHWPTSHLYFVSVKRT